MGWTVRCALLALISSGCGGGGSQSLNSAPPGPAPPPSLRIVLDAEEAEAGEQARHYRLELLDGDTVLQSQTVDRPGAAPFPIQLEGIPPGTYLLRVAGFSADGRYLGRFEQEVEFPTSEQVIVSSIWDPGKTREIGLVSVNDSGEPFRAPSHECVTNSNGRFVFFQSGDNEPRPGVSRLFLRDRLLQRTIQIAESGEDISISGDGRWLVFASDFEYFLFDRLNGPVRSFGHHTSSISPDGNFILSRNIELERISRSTGQRRTIQQAGTNARLSGDSRLLASLVQGPGGHGIQIHELSSGTIRFFPVDPFILDMAFSGDGRWVAFVEVGPQFERGPLRLLDIQTGSITTIASDVHSGVSISHDGMVVSFISSLENLVFNDINRLPDLFVWNRRTRQIARVNVAPDDQAVFGGVAVNNPETFGPPSLSSDGRRLVFLAKDSLLVPETAANDVAVFSSQVPGAGILYVSSGNRLLRFRNAELLAGNAPPETVLFEAPAGTSLGALYLDVAQDRLFAVVKSLPRGEVRVFDNASTRASTDPTILLPIAANGISGDSTRDLVYISRQATAQVPVQVVRTAFSGALTQVGSFFMPGASGRVVAVDTRHDEIFLGSPSLLKSYRGASTLSGDASFTFGSSISGPEAQLQDVLAAALDPTPIADLSATSSSDLFVFSGTGSTGRLALFNGLVRFFSQGQDPIRLRQGFALEESAQMAFDRFSGMLYLSNPSATFVFNSFRSSKTTNPDRVLNVPSQGLILDRTH